MVKFKLIILALTIMLIVVTSWKNKLTITIRDDFKKYYEQSNVSGSFVVYDQKNNHYTFYNKAQVKQIYIPSSTFKICNSLIGLETGVIKDADFIIKWDSVMRQNPNWNVDHSLKTAFKNSTVWYYQELAKRVGGTQMKYWLDKAQYGNTDTTGGIDKFWLTGSLRISPEQQLSFLKQLYNNQLPFSKRSMDIVKQIMIAKETKNYIIRAKTGWGTQNNIDIGWYVGYVETKNNVYYFVNCIQSADFNNNSFAKARTEITYQILNELKITQE